MPLALKGSSVLKLLYQWKTELAPLVVEESEGEILYAMYMNSTLHESFGLPVWFDMDAEENRLLACFSLSTFELTASKLAEA